MSVIQIINYHVFLLPVVLWTVLYFIEVLLHSISNTIIFVSQEVINKTATVNWDTTRKKKY